MNLEDKNVTICQLAISKSPKKHFIQTSGHYLSHLGVESELGTNIKFVVLHSNINFYERSNFISGPKS